MLGLQLLVKMLHVQIEIVIAVETQNLFHHRQRNSLGRRLSPPPVEQSVIPELLIALPPTPHPPVADANNLRRLIFFAMARKMTSCTFIARSIAAFE
jgi:hypothetical protein